MRSMSEFYRFPDSCQAYSHGVQMKKRPYGAFLGWIVAEGQGFEPWIPVTQDNRLAGGRTRPLCDPSAGLHHTQPRLPATRRHEQASLDGCLCDWRRALAPTPSYLQQYERSSE